MRQHQKIDRLRTAIRKKGFGGNRTPKRRDAATSSPAVSDSDTLRTNTQPKVLFTRILNYSKFVEIVQGGRNKIL